LNSIIFIVISVIIIIWCISSSPITC